MVIKESLMSDEEANWIISETLSDIRSIHMSVLAVISPFENQISSRLMY